MEVEWSGFSKVTVDKTNPWQPRNEMISSDTLSFCMYSNQEFLVTLLILLPPCDGDMVIAL